MTSFVFFGRLTKEKGFDLLFPFFREVSTIRDDVRFFVFGSGPLEERFRREFELLPHFYDVSNRAEALLAEGVDSIRGGLYYFGHRNFAAIKEFLSVCDASVMPSRFLETFGLSALESLSVGVPVICFPKGGLTNFLVAPEYGVMYKGDDEMLSNRLMECLESVALLSGKTKALHKKQAEKIALEFSKERWISELSSHIEKTPSKILLVSDFSGKLGGIETHVQTIAKTLTEAGHEVEIFSHPIKKWTLLTRVRVIMTSWYNYVYARKIQKKIEQFQPDIIWCHSVLRFMGHKVLKTINTSSAKKWITYHDLGYFAPQAASMDREKEIPGSTFKEFYASASWLYKIFPLYLVIRYHILRLLFKELAQFNLHLVPSDFILKPLAYWLPRKSNKQVLPHFISKD